MDGIGITPKAAMAVFWCAQAAQNDIIQLFWN